MVLYPYLHYGTWVFDDEATGLVREAFVMGIPAILEDLHQRENIQHPETGFRLLFSANPFPSYQVKGSWLREESGGNWYRTEDGKEGWLCPALFKYFPSAPENIYIRAETLNEPLQKSSDEEYLDYQESREKGWWGTFLEWVKN